MNIEIIENDNDKLRQVIELANQNSKTLGFFPKGAFIQKAHEKKILVALEDEEVIGYLLFDYNTKVQIVYIVHLCISQFHRGKGIAKNLIAKLETVAENSCGG